MPDFMSILNGLTGSDTAPAPVAGLDPGAAAGGVPLPPARPGELGGPAQPKVLATLRKPQDGSGSGGMLLPFGSASKMPAPSANKFGALLQGVDAGLTSIAEGQKGAEASRAASIKARIEQAKTLFDMDRKLATEKRDNDKQTFEQGPKFQEQSRQADARNVTLKTMAEGKAKAATDPILTQQRISNIVSNHPAQKAMDLDDAQPIPSLRMPAERRAGLQAQVDAERQRLMGIATKGGGSDDDDDETSTPAAGADGTPIPPARPKDTVDPKVRLGQAAAALESGADPGAVKKMLDGFGVDAPGDFFSPAPSEPAN